MTSVPTAVPITQRRTVLLLWAGVVGGLLITAVSGTLALVRPGFDIRRHANSQLVLGDGGWIQTLDFIAFGVLMVACGVGIWRAVSPSRAGRLAAAGVVVYGLGSGIVVGFNPTDPALGFPPGSAPGYPGYDAISTSAKVHGVAGMVGFLAITIACFAFARYFWSLGANRWTVLSAGMGTAVLAVCGYLAAGASAAAGDFNLLPTWVVGAALWCYVSAVAYRLIAALRNGRG
jgi:hypothetical protein